MKKESVSVKVKSPRNNHRKDSYDDYFNPKHFKLQQKN